MLFCFTPVLLKEASWWFVLVVLELIKLWDDHAIKVFILIHSIPVTGFVENKRVFLIKTFLFRLYIYKKPLLHPSEIIGAQNLLFFLVKAGQGLTHVGICGSTCVILTNVILWPNVEVSFWGINSLLFDVWWESFFF